MGLNVVVLVVFFVRHGLQILSNRNVSYLIIFILYQAWNPRQPKHQVNTKPSRKFCAPYATLPKGGSIFYPRINRGLKAPIIH